MNQDLQIPAGKQPGGLKSTTEKKKHGEMLPVPDMLSALPVCNHGDSERLKGPGPMYVMMMTMTMRMILRFLFEYLHFQRGGAHSQCTGDQIWTD